MTVVAIFMQRKIESTEGTVLSRKVSSLKKAKFRAKLEGKKCLVRLFFGLFFGLFLCDKLAKKEEKKGKKRM